MSEPQEIIAKAMWTVATEGLEPWESLDESEKPLALEGADRVLADLKAQGWKVVPMRWIDTDEARELFESVAEDDA